MTYLKRIIGTVLFALAFCLIMRVLSPIFEPKNNDPQSGIEEVEASGILGEPDNSIDVVFFGDSVAFCAFNPLEIWKTHGYTSYMCATSGQTMDYAKISLKRLLKKQAPKLLVVETDTFYREQDLTDRVYSDVREAFTVVRYHNRWKMLSAADFTTAPNYTWKEDYKGYHLKTDRQAATNPNYMAPTDEVEQASFFNRDSFLAIKKVCDDNGIALVLISAPSATNWNYARHNALVKIAEEAGVEFYDLNLMTEEVPIDWANDSLDGGDHLNIFGTRKVDAWFVEYLASTGLVDSRRDDPNLRHWDEALGRYENALPEGVPVV
ncbi:MAG: hypothetical protein Q4B73_02650 [Lachnospiraceae bacterium]|nr:hypothetical protein [Lachnospiraceae bacterium]